MTVRRSVFVSLLLAMLLGTVACAQAPTVTTPKNGDRIGPSVDVKGSLGHYGLMVVITDVYNSKTNEKLASVPGIRHYTEQNGTFAFRISTPRNAWGENVPLTYKIRTFELKGKDSPGPETVVTCYAEDR